VIGDENANECWNNSNQFSQHISSNRNLWRDTNLIMPRKEVLICLMLVPCILHVVEMTNNMHGLYHSFILSTGSYMFRQ
jgi:hypothetical protein